MSLESLAEHFGLDPEQAREHAARLRERRAREAEREAPPTDVREAVERLQDRVDHLLAGADPTPKHEYAVPTPGQLWKRLCDAGEEERLEILGRMIESTNRADGDLFKVQAAQNLARAWMARGVMRSHENTIVAQCGEQLARELGNLTE